MATYLLTGIFVVVPRGRVTAMSLADCSYTWHWWVWTIAACSVVDSWSNLFGLLWMSAAVWNGLPFIRWTRWTRTV